ncbi:cytochrome P450 6B5-like [Galleria mellonella]|uniref:unspecific monooxygenase n=1 Tax=Galleria mellonella TaxID=7137 RepID=A0ABM3MQK7_GALME|nr:cytochrome P450 6B5-like [Galleria mellonella]
MLPIFLVLTSVVILLLSYFIDKYNESYWKKRGVKLQDHFKLGIFGQFIAGNRSMFELISELYEKYRKEPAVGLSASFNPALFVIDKTNVQHVLQQDFQSFNHRGIDINEGDLLADNILFMNGNRWKLMRQNMTSMFTSAKLKNMYYIMDKSAMDFIAYLNKNPEKLDEDTFELMSQYCSVAIGASVFGVTSESVFESPILNTTKILFRQNFKTNVKFTIFNISPWLGKILGIKLFGEFEDFFIGVIKKLLRQREQENVQKHDFADKAVSLQRKGTMIDRETGLELEPTDELLAAQAFFFFNAGVEPSATAMLGALFELGKNPDHLQRVQDEIDATFEKYNGKLTYEAVMEMEYLENVLSEALRMYPPIGFLTRKCVRDTVLPVGNIPVKEGTNIITPIFDIHYDPEYYPNPTVFDPTRFENDSLQNSTLYMPFGKGNRLCVGVRYARLQVKTGLVHILRNFTVKSKVLDDKIIYKKAQVQVRPGNLDIKFIPRQHV